MCVTVKMKKRLLSILCGNIWCFLAPVRGGIQRRHGGEREHGRGEVAPQRAVPVIMLPLGGWLSGSAGTWALATWPRVAGVCPWGQHGREARDVGQGLGVVLPRHAGRLDVHASQKRPVAWHHSHWENLLRGPLLLTLFGSPVLKPHLLRQGWVSRGFYIQSMVGSATNRATIELDWTKSGSLIRLLHAAFLQHNFGTKIWSIHPTMIRHRGQGPLYL